MKESGNNEHSEKTRNIDRKRKIRKEGKIKGKMEIT
jgi:hypothetical protein